jgi:hypothetical protein
VTGGSTGNLSIGSAYLGTGSNNQRQVPAGTRCYAAFFINRPLTTGETTGLENYLGAIIGL